MTETSFQNLDAYTHEDVQKAIQRNDPAELLYVPIAVSLHDEDAHWAEALCLKLGQHSDPTVRGNAILGLGHLARRFEKLSAEALVLINEGLNDPDPHVRAQSSVAKDDIETFIPPNGFGK